MKKILAFLLTLLMAIGMFSGCDSNLNHVPTTEPTEVVTDPTIDETETPAETTAPETEVPTEAETEDPTEAPTEPEATECKHDYEKTVVAPTQSAQGYTLYTCKKCGDEYTSDYTEKLPADETEPVHQHSYDSTVTKEAACTEDGVRTYTCSCGASYTEAIAKTGHSWGNWVQSKAPTTEAEGQETRTCNNCGKTETRSIDKLPSDDGGNDEGSGGEGGYYIDLMGNKVYWNCSAQGHLAKDSKGTIIQETSCCTERIVQYECKVIGCGKTWTEVTVPVTGRHVMSDADRAKITRGDTLYRIRCRCGHGIYQYTHDAAMAAWEAHAAENLYMEPCAIQEESIEHSHKFPSGTFVCVNCKQEIAFSESYAGCNGVNCKYG